jgi:hypothetical protein
VGNLARLSIFKGENKMSNTYEKNQMIGLLYRIFQSENYTWLDNSESPTYEEIKKCVEELEYSALDHKGFCESGRIRVEYDKETQTFSYYLELGGY